MLEQCRKMELDIIMAVLIEIFIDVPTRQYTIPIPLLNIVMQHSFFTLW